MRRNRIDRIIDRTINEGIKDFIQSKAAKISGGLGKTDANCANNAIAQALNGIRRQVSELDNVSASITKKTGEYPVIKQKIDAISQGLDNVTSLVLDALNADVRTDGSNWDWLKDRRNTNTITSINKLNKRY